MMITNLTVWKDMESLRAFTYQTALRHFLQNRSRWFDRVDQGQVVLWWVPVGETPCIEIAMARLDMLEQSGPTERAFTFAQAFDSSGKQLKAQ